MLMRCWNPGQCMIYSVSHVPGVTLPTHTGVWEPLAAAYGYINLSGRGPDNEVHICLGSLPSICQLARTTKRSF